MMKQVKLREKNIRNDDAVDLETKKKNSETDDHDNLPRRFDFGHRNMRQNHLSFDRLFLESLQSVNDCYFDEMKMKTPQPVNSNNEQHK